MSKVICENYKSGNCRLGWRCPNSHRWDRPVIKKVDRPLNKRSYYNTKTLERINSREVVDQTLWHKFLFDLDMKISQYHAVPDLIVISSPYRNSLVDIVSALDTALDVYGLSYISPVIVDYLFTNEKEISNKLKFVPSINMDEITTLMPIMCVIIIEIVSSEMIKFPMDSANLIPKYGNINNHDGNNSINVSSLETWKMRWSIDERIISKNFKKIMNDICLEIKSNDEIKKCFSVQVCDDEMSVTLMEMNEVMSQPIGQIMDDDELEAELAALEELEADEILSNYDGRSTVTRQSQPHDGDYDVELAELEAMMN